VAEKATVAFYIPTTSSVPFMDFDQLFLEHVAASYDKQMALGDLIGQNEWHFDMESHTLSFGSKHAFKVQVIGTESAYSNSWLWAWANAESAIPAPMLRASEQLRAFGEQHAIPQLTESTSTLTHELNGHIFCMIATGLCKGGAYYRGPYDGGALFMLIRDDQYPRWAHNPAVRVSTIFPQLISNISVSNHRLALIHYLRFYRATISESADTVTGQFSNTQLITARFLPDNRLDTLKVKPAP
jgi:hypothetical protein